MANLKITYDRMANAAYISFAHPDELPAAARTYPCDPVEVDGMINLDFDEAGRLIGVEVLAASSKLPQYVLDTAQRLDVDGS